MKLVLRLVGTGIDGSSRSVDVLEIVSRNDPSDIAALGITLSQGKQLLALIQQEVVAAQCRDRAARRPNCRSCAAVCQLKDYRPRQIATLFGQVTLRLPRFRCAGCGMMEAAVGWRSASTLANASHKAREVLASLKAVPICGCGCCDSRRDSLPPSRASALIHLKVAFRSAPTGHAPSANRH